MAEGAAAAATAHSRPLIELGCQLESFGILLVKSLSELAHHVCTPNSTDQKPPSSHQQRSVLTDRQRTDKCADNQINRQTDRQTEKCAERQTNRQHAQQQPPFSSVFKASEVFCSCLSRCSHCACWSPRASSTAAIHQLGSVAGLELQHCT